MDLLQPLLPLLLSCFPVAVPLLSSQDCPVTLCAAALRILCPFIICHVVNLPPALIVLLLLLLLLWLLGVNVTVDSVSAPAHQLPAMRLSHPFGRHTPYAPSASAAQAFQTVSQRALSLPLALSYDGFIRTTYCYVLYIGNRKLVSFSCRLIVVYPRL